jgi:Na+/serine symporter
LDPLMVTELPVYPFSGLTVEMAGAGITVTMLVLLDRTPLVLQVPAPTHVNTQK